ncbi:hypothetical protein [Ureibacillus acetophenoni]|uniref:Uncharacterized protein n=1 Tax=Ureibacillus acetophenoni TaxID=614649 RepID=A0A285UEN3_9BACL|nr:hypothetical protein [Ureibacillus acetophenoni]SOC40269.1 hypothetical protein SAMN05877842_107164 [Ureibacillus acetophenoni]
MDIYLLYFIGLIILFLTITYAVRYGIDTSKQVKSLRIELKEIKRKIEDLEKKRNEN